MVAVDSVIHMQVTEATKKAVYRYRWVMFVLLLAAYFFVYFHRVSVNAVGTEMIDEVGQGSKEFLSSVYFWVYAAMQIPSGILADRLGPRRAMTIFLAIASAGSLLTFAGTDFLMLAVGKALIAAGMAVIYVPTMKIISVWFGKEDFPQLNGIVIAVGNVGALAGAAPLVMLAAAIGWREVFLLLGMVSVLICVLCLLLIRDHPHDKGLPGIEEIEEAETGIPPEERSDARLPTLTGIGAVIGSGRIFWTMGIAYFLVYGTIMVFQGTVAIKYFESHVYTFALAAWFITALGASKIVSTLLIGRMISRGIVSSKKKLMAFGTGMYVLVWAVIWLFAGDVDSEMFWFAVCALFGFFSGFMTLSFTQVKEWFPVSIAGTAISFMNVLLFLGAAVFTTASGIILHTVYSLENYSSLWGLMFAAATVALLMVLISRERREGDPMISP